MKLRPLEDRIVIMRLDAEEKTAGGIILPDSAQEKPMQGKVLAVGPGKTSDAGNVTPVDVEIGDVVLFGKYAGTEVQVEGEDRLILKESEVLAKVN